jgi:hypothetical protein
VQRELPWILFAMAVALMWSHSAGNGPYPEAKYFTDFKDSIEIGLISFLLVVS